MCKLIFKNSVDENISVKYSKIKKRLYMTNTIFKDFTIHDTKIAKRTKQNYIEI